MANSWDAASSGVRLAEQDQLNNAVALQKLEAGSMELDEARRERAFWQEQGGKMQSPAGGQQGGSQGEQLMRLGGEMLSKGVVKPGLEALSKGSVLLNNESLVADRKMTMMKNQAEMLGGMAGAVGDQDSYDNFRMYLKNAGFPQAAQLPDDYSVAAPLLKQLREGSITYAKKLELGMRERTAKTAEANSTSVIAHRKVMENIAERNAQTARMRVEKAAEGAALTATATANEISQASKLIRSTLFPTFKLAVPAADQDEDYVTMKSALDAGAASVASEAKRIAKQNRGMSYDEALQQALAESKKKGEWDVVKTYENSWLGMKWGEKQQQRFKGPKVLPANPQDYELGQLYTLPDGQVGMRVEGGFEVDTVEEEE